MSFSIETKNELARSEPEKKCCQLSEIAGFLRMSAEPIKTESGDLEIVITTENAAVTRHYKKLIEEYFNIDTGLEIGDAGRLNGGYRYGLVVRSGEKNKSILKETGIITEINGTEVVTEGICDRFFKTKCCRKSYLRGMFMSGGSVTDPEKAYHLEIVCSNEKMARDLKRLINTFYDLSAKVTERKNRYIVYMKNSGNIRDTLALMGAHSHTLKFDDIMLKRAMVNEAVRMTNCDTANTDRALDASEKQVRNIRIIQEEKGLKFLSEKQREVAEIRLAHPEMNLTQIGEMLDPPLKKSAVNSRFRKINEIASKLEK